MKEAKDYDTSQSSKLTMKRKMGQDMSTKTYINKYETKNMDSGE